jgi:hypothetical protein
MAGASQGGLDQVEHCREEHGDGHDAGGETVTDGAFAKTVRHVERLLIATISGGRAALNTYLRPAEHEEQLSLSYA